MISSTYSCLLSDSLLILKGLADEKQSGFGEIN